MREVEVRLRAIQVAAQNRLPPGLKGVEMRRATEMVYGMLTDQITAFVYGLEGQKAVAERIVVEARLPRWLPKFLQRRWSRAMRLRVDATPMLVFPDMTLDVPHLGKPVRMLGLVHEDYEAA